ncbi:MAG: hypothetical protein ACI4SB_08500 [Acutalibacteraceae bacterium]
MKLINNYSRCVLKEEQVYIFPVTLCDNEVDRDFEKFSVDALEKLKRMFLGRTGIFDHSMKASGQSARIFKTWVETDDGRLTSQGEPYTALKAKAYMVRTDENKALIDEIDAGIKKEVSVGCSVKKTVCSICGKDMKTRECEHIKGRTYSGKLCYGILSQPTDAYEWSFVAVPSQREAGVTKSFIIKEEENTDIIETVKSASGEILISKSQAQEIAKYISELEQYEHEAKAYRNSLVSGIEKLCMLVLPKVNVKLFTKGLDCLSVEKLETLKSGLQQQADNLIPPAVQLKHENTQKSTSNNDAFKI